MWRKIAIRAVLMLAGLGALIYAAFYIYNQGRAVERAVFTEYRAKAEKQIADLKKANLNVNDRVVTEYIVRTNTIREKQIVYRDVIKYLEPKAELSNAWVHIHDAAVTQTPIDEAVVADQTPCSVSQAVLCGIRSLHRFGKSLQMG